MKTVSRDRSLFPGDTAPAAVLFLLLALLLFAPVFQYGFVWDDWEYLVHHSLVQGSEPFSLKSVFLDTRAYAASPDAQIYRPVRQLFFMAQYRIFGDHPSGYHGVSILLHAGVTTLVYFMLRLLMNLSPRAAFCWGFLFLAHPLQTQAVCWIKAQDDLLAAFFAITALLVFARSSPGRQGWSACFWLALALFSKESTAGLVLLFIAWPLVCQDLPGKPGKGLRAALGLVTLVFFVFRYLAIGQIGQAPWPGGNFFQTQLGMAGVIVDALARWWIPLSPRINYLDWNPLQEFTRFQLLLGWAGILAGSTWYALRGGMYRFAGAALLASWIPVANGVPLILWGAERFFYLPMAFWIMVLAGLMHAMPIRVPWKRRTGWIFFILLLLLWMPRHGRFMSVWKSDATLGEAMLSQNTASYHGLHLMLSGLRRESRYHEMLLWTDHYLPVNPGDSRLHHHRWIALLALGKQEEAAALLETARKRFPEDALWQGWQGPLNETPASGN